MTKEEKILHEIYDNKKEKFINIAKRELDKKELKKFLNEEFENALAALRINEWNLKKYVGEYNILNKNIWYTWEKAQAYIKNLLAFINNWKENEE